MHRFSLAVPNSLMDFTSGNLQACLMVLKGQSSRAKQMWTENLIQENGPAGMPISLPVMKIVLRSFLSAGLIFSDLKEFICRGMLIYLTKMDFCNTGPAFIMEGIQRVE